MKKLNLPILVNPIVADADLVVDLVDIVPTGHLALGVLIVIESSEEEAHRTKVHPIPTDVVEMQAETATTTKSDMENLMEIAKAASKDANSDMELLEGATASS